jgi:spermidine/putrescine-binding protein
MKKRLLATMALTATAVVAAVSLAAPAQAQVPGYVKYNSYGWGDQCLGIGYYGQTNHTWQAYYCETVAPSGATGPGLYNLWVLY